MTGPDRGLAGLCAKRTRSNSNAPQNGPHRCACKLSPSSTQRAPNTDDELAHWLASPEGKAATVFELT